LIFLDTGFLYALVDIDDENHGGAGTTPQVTPRGLEPQ